MNITLEQAERVTEAAKGKANDIGVPVSIAVVDTGGNLVSLERMDNAILASLDIAIGKAYTAVAMKMSTADLAPVVQPGQPLYNVEIANQPRTLVAFGGGIPLQANGEVVGGVGVSGERRTKTKRWLRRRRGWSKGRSRSTAPSVRFFRFEAAPAKAPCPFSEGDVRVAIDLWGYQVDAR